MIYALNNATKKDKRRVINIVKRHNTKKEKVQEVIDFVNQSGGLDYAKEAMYKYRKEALDILDDFPDSQVKSSLKNLVFFVTERKK